MDAMVTGLSPIPSGWRVEREGADPLDAIGPIGGYNFLWAWATGRAAGVGSAGQ